MKPLIKTIVSNPKKIKFKFIFSDASVSLAEGENLNEATILALAGRIRSRKPKNLIGAWVRDEENKWVNVAKQNIVIPI